jgi:hypothetical protein
MDRLTGGVAVPRSRASHSSDARPEPIDVPMSQLVRTAAQPPSALRPNRVSIWPVEDGVFGIDFTYHGATGYQDAERAQRVLDQHGLRTSFRQELDGAWSVRLGPIPRQPMREVLDRFAWSTTCWGVYDRAPRERPTATARSRLLVRASRRCGTSLRLSKTPLWLDSNGIRRSVSERLR